MSGAACVRFHGATDVPGVRAAEQLAEVFVEINDALVDDFELLEFLALVAARSAWVSRCHSAGLLLADSRGRLQFAAASEESADLVELLSLQAEEGPSQVCVTTSSPVVSADLSRARGRWPRFAPLATAAGFRSVYVLPLRHRGDVMGVLNLLSTDTRPLQPSDVSILQGFADIATIGLLHNGVVRDRELRFAELERVLDDRAALEQAKGALAQQRGISVAAASDLITEHAQHTGRSLSSVGRAVLTDPDLIPAEPDRLLTPSEVAAMFRVDPKTITRWSQSGRLPSVRTIGGHRRFHHSDVVRLLKPH